MSCHDVVWDAAIAVAAANARLEWACWGLILAASAIIVLPLLLRIEDRERERQRLELEP